MALLNIGKAIVLWIILTISISIYATPAERRSVLSLILLFFNHLNLFIALCEIVLGLHIKTIQDDYLKLRETYKGKELDACAAFMFMPLELSELFDGKKWSRMWSTYSLYDPSYQNNESFGFFIDVGNGWTTIIPTFLVDAAIISPSLLSSYFDQAHIVVGCFGIATYWQMMYGTYIYFLSYVFNARYKGKSFAEVAGFVGVSNVIWVLFPTFGLYASYSMLREGNMSVFEI